MATLKAQAGHAQTQEVLDQVDGQKNMEKPNPGRQSRCSCCVALAAKLHGRVWDGPSRKLYRFRGFSKFVMPHVLVRHNDDPDRVLASLGNAKWAALGWPAVRAGELDGKHLYKLSQNRKVSANHIVP